MPRQVSSWMERLRDGAIDAAAAAMPSQLLGRRDVAELEPAERHPAGRQELDAAVALQLRRPIGLLTTRQRRVRDHLRA